MGTDSKNTLKNAGILKRMTGKVEFDFETPIVQIPENTKIDIHDKIKLEQNQAISRIISQKISRTEDITSKSFNLPYTPGRKCYEDIEK